MQMTYVKSNIQLYFKFYANTELYKQKNKLFTFRVYSINDFPSMMDRLIKEGFIFLKGFLEGKIDGLTLFNYPVITSKSKQMEYNFANIEKVKDLCYTNGSGGLDKKQQVWDNPYIRIKPKSISKYHLPEDDFSNLYPEK